MKRTVHIFLSIVLCSLATVTFSQKLYGDYKPYEKTEIFFESFDNQSEWKIDDANTGLEFKEGTCLLTSKLENDGRKMAKKVKINTKKDFEIEANFRLVSGSSKCFNYLFWGSNFNKKNDFLYFGFTCQGEFAVGKSVTDAGFVDFISFKKTPVKVRDYTKLTIRKIGDQYYFWINESFFGQYKFEKLLGEELGFYSGDGATIQIKDISVQYLMEKA